MLLRLGSWRSCSSERQIHLLMPTKVVSFPNLGALMKNLRLLLAFRPPHAFAIRLAGIDGEAMRHANCGRRR